MFRAILKSVTLSLYDTHPEEICCKKALEQAKADIDEISRLNAEENAKEINLWHESDSDSTTTGHLDNDRVQQIWQGVRAFTRVDGSKLITKHLFVDSNTKLEDKETVVSLLRCCRNSKVFAKCALHQLEELSAFEIPTPQLFRLIPEFYHSQGLSYHAYKWCMLKLSQEFREPIMIAGLRASTILACKAESLLYPLHVKELQHYALVHDNQNVRLEALRCLCYLTKLKTASYLYLDPVAHATCIVQSDEYLNDNQMLLLLISLYRTEQDLSSILEKYDNAFMKLYNRFSFVNVCHIGCTLALAIGNCATDREAAVCKKHVNNILDILVKNKRFVEGFNILKACSGFLDDDIIYHNMQVPLLDEITRLSISDGEMVTTLSKVYTNLSMLCPNGAYRQRTKLLELATHLDGAKLILLRGWLLAHFLLSTELSVQPVNLLTNVFQDAEDPITLYTLARLAHFYGFPNLAYVGILFVRRCLVMKQIQVDMKWLILPQALALCNSKMKAFCEETRRKKRKNRFEKQTLSTFLISTSEFLDTYADSFVYNQSYANLTKAKTTFWRKIASYIKDSENLNQTLEIFSYSFSKFFEDQPYSEIHFLRFLKILNEDLYRKQVSLIYCTENVIHLEDLIMLLEVEACVNWL